MDKFEQNYTMFDFNDKGLCVGITQCCKAGDFRKRRKVYKPNHSSPVVGEENRVGSAGSFIPPPN